MYLGGRTITHLKAFLDGWLYGKEEEITDVQLLDEFQAWIQDKYNVKGSQSWAKVILFHSADEYAALDNFFELFNKFLDQKIK